MLPLTVIEFTLHMFASLFEVTSLDFLFSSCILVFSNCILYKQNKSKTNKYYFMGLSLYSFTNLPEGGAADLAVGLRISSTTP